MSGHTHVVVGTAAGTTVTITRESATSERPQGLVCEADHPMTVAGIEATQVVFWADSAPPTTELLTSDAGELRMWHVWREGDLIQAWEREARIDVADEEDDLGLSCHDGHAGGEPDLVLRVSFDRAWTQPSGERD